MATDNHISAASAASYGTGGTVVHSAEGPPISMSAVQADKGIALARRGFERITAQLKPSFGEE